MADPRLLSTDDLTTLGGAIAIVVTVSNALHYAMGWAPKYVGLAVSFVVATIGVAAGDASTWQSWVIGFFNAFVIYCGAVGVSSMAPGTAATMSRVAAQAAPAQQGDATAAEELVPPIPKVFWRPWY